MRLISLCALALIAGATWSSEGWADEQAPSGGNWLGRWFRFGKQANDKDHQIDVAPETLPASIIDHRARAEEAFHRRIAICLKLQMIANETRDDDLLKQAQQLEIEVWQHFTRSTAGIGQ